MISGTLKRKRNRDEARISFYLPAEPDPPVLPSNVRQEELVSECRLGFVWSEVEEWTRCRRGEGV